MTRILLAAAFSILLAAAFSILLAAVPARAESGPTFVDLKSQAMGNTGVASSEGATALFLNPAGLADDQGIGGGLSLDIGLNAVLLDYATWAADNSKYLNNMDSLLTKIGPIDDKWAPFSQSSLIYGTFQGIAVAALIDTRYDLTVAKAVVTPVLGVGALSDLVLTAGRGFQAPEGYKFGFALKYIYRLRFQDRLLGSTDEPFYTVKRVLEGPDRSWSDKLNKISVAGDVSQTEQAVGLNLGAEKEVNENWTAGISLLDFPTVMASAFVRPDIDLGLAYHRDLDLVPDLGNKLLVNLDFQRFLIPGTPWFKQVKAGVALQGQMGKRPVGYIALGLNDGYPTFGVRVGYILYLSYVYVAEETGTYPGQEKLSFHKLALDLAL